MEEGATEPTEVSFMHSIEAKQNIIFCVLTLLLNILAVALVAASPPLQKSSKFHIICSMGVANIVACLVYFPLRTQEALEDHVSDTLDPTTRILLSGIHSYCMPSVLAVSISFIAVDTMVNKIYNASTQRKIVTSLAGIAVTWIFSLISLFPYITLQHSLASSSSAGHSSPSTSVNHSVEVLAQQAATNNSTDIRYSLFHSAIESTTTEGPTVPASLVLTLILLWGLIPLTLVLVTTLSAFAMRFCVRKSQGYVVANNTAFPNEDHIIGEISLWDTLASAVIFIILSIPFFVEAVEGISCDLHGQCSCIQPSTRSVILARWSISFILPALWILDGQYREACAVLLSKLCFGPCVVY